MVRIAIPLQRVFHGIRFKVNKDWTTAVVLFLCPYLNTHPPDTFVASASLEGQRLVRSHVASASVVVQGLDGNQSDEEYMA